MTDLILATPDELYLHPLNPRAHHDPAEVEAKAKSLEAVGQIHNLACYRDPEREGLGVVAGGYRYLAFRQIEEEHPGTVAQMGNIRCLVTEDPLIAEAWAVAENLAQVPLSPAEEIRAYGKMARHGNSPASIARAFCTTEAHVRRRLKLADLPEPALDALAAGEISLGVAEALTTAGSEKRALEVLEEACVHRHGEAQVRAMLHGTDVRLGNRRVTFVGLEAYEDAGGQVTRDLFADHTWLTDEPLLDRLMAAKLATIAEAEVAPEGWAFVWTTDKPSPWEDGRVKGMELAEPEAVELPEADADELEDLAAAGRWRLSDEEKARLDELETRAAGSLSEAQIAESGVMLYVDFNGALKRLEGLMLPATAAREDGDDTTTGATPAEPPAPDLSEALKSDLRAVALRARQSAMLAKTELALDLLAFQLEGRQTWGNPLSITTTRPLAKPEITDGLADSPALADPEILVDPTAAAFQAFQAKGKKHRNEVLTHALARHLQPGRESLYRHLNTVTGVNPRGIWTPTERNFFSRVKGAYLDKLAGELLHDADDDRLKALHAMKVKDKAKELGALFNDAATREAWGLSREQAARLDTWLPEEIAEMTKGEG